MSDPNRKYNLTLTETQADLLVRALDAYSRIGMGQFENILEVYDRPCRLDIEAREALRRGLNIAKTAAGHPANGSYGIQNDGVRDEFRAAYDIQQVVRHRLAWDRNPEGGFGFNFDQPHQISTLDLPEMEKVE